MAAPWTTTAKSVALSGQTGRRHAVVPGPRFVPAPLLSTINFPPAMLYAALAKTTALGTARTVLLSALTSSDQALIEAIVDDVGGDFLFTNDAIHLGSDIRKALAGRIGAALCHIYMDQMGYSWLDYASGYINTKNALADFLYDGASLGSTGLALAEAKGSLSPSASAKAVKSKADSAYNLQVNPHLGTTTVAGRIEYGCAIASAIVPAHRWTPMHPSCFLHVTETVASPAAAPAAHGAPANPRRSGDVLQVNSLLALRNYRAVFRLIEAPYMVDFIDDVVAGRAPDGEFVQRFGRLTTDGGDDRWLVGDAFSHPDAEGYSRANRLMTRDVFALEERSFVAILKLVRACAEDRGQLLRPFPFPNLALPRTLAIDGERGHRPARDFGDDLPVRTLLGDGLAVIRRRGASFPNEENFIWPG